jgi:hypothetical protein
MLAKLTKTILISAAGITALLLPLLQQLQQAAQAYPCVGDGSLTEKYCTGYHDGAIQARRDFHTGNGLDLDQHKCTASIDYCKGYTRGYSDESDILG